MNFAKTLYSLRLSKIFNAELLIKNLLNSANALRTLRLIKTVN